MKSIVKWEGSEARPFTEDDDISLVNSVRAVAELVVVRDSWEDVLV